MQPFVTLQHEGAPSHWNNSVQTFLHQAFLADKNDVDQVLGSHDIMALDF
jgi:hypothetical protein